jgi:hypothetical protein
MPIRSWLRTLSGAHAVVVCLEASLGPGIAVQVVSSLSEDAVTVALGLRCGHRPVPDNRCIDGKIHAT